MAVGNRKRGFGGKGKAALRAARGGDTPRVSLYDEVTAKIIAELEAGCFPWAQPWSSAAAVPGLPRNAVSGRPYSGVNVLILWGAVIEGCYPSQDWLTFRQALAAGGCVRKGERGHTVSTPTASPPTLSARAAIRHKANRARFRSSNALLCSMQRNATDCPSG